MIGDLQVDRQPRELASVIAHMRRMAERCRDDARRAEDHVKAGALEAMAESWDTRADLLMGVRQ